MASIKELQTFAAEIRYEVAKQLGTRGFGHIGGSFSITDTLAVLYGDVMKYDPKNPKWEARDKLVMSKGHAGPAVYASLALKGFFPMDMLATLNQPGTSLPSHCDARLTPGIDMTTGSLGQGTSAAIGLALAQKMDELDSYVYLITGDGEINEGQCWEAAMFAPQYRLNNLVWFVDCNQKQLDGTTNDIMNLGDVAAKFASFGWHTQDIDGNDIGAIQEAISIAKAETSKPSCIVLNTIKGKGSACIENLEFNHHIVLEGEILEKVLSDTKSSLDALKGEA